MIKAQSKVAKNLNKERIEIKGVDEPNHILSSQINKNECLNSQERMLKMFQLQKMKSELLKEPNILKNVHWLK